MPTWLGQAPSGTGWRYMHDDGRVEDIDPAQVGLPTGWAPPGFEASAPEPSAPMGGDPNLGVAPLEPPQFTGPALVQPTVTPEVAAPVPPTSSSGQTGSSIPTEGAPQRSASARSSYTGPGESLDWKPSGDLERRAMGMALEREKSYAPVYGAREEAIRREGEIRASEAEARQRNAEQLAIQERTNATDRQIELDEIEQQSQTWAASIEEAANSVPPMDTNKVFHDADGAQQVALAGAAFISGFLGVSAPMDIINRAVDRSIQQQQNAQEQAQRKVWNLKDLAKTDIDEARWQLAQGDINRMAHYTAIERDLEVQLQGFQSDLYRNNTIKLLADVKMQKLETRQSSYINDRNFLHQQWVDRQKAARESQSLALQARESEARINEMTQPKPTDQSIGVVNSPITGKKYAIDPLRYGSDPKNPKVTAAQMADLDAKWQVNAGIGESVRELVDETKAAGSVYGGLFSKNKFTSSEDKEAMRGLHSRLVSTIMKKRSGAAFTKEEMEKVVEEVGSVETWLQVGPRKQLANLMRRTGTEQDRVAKSLGLRSFNDDGTFGAAYDPETEFVLPELADPTPQTAGSATRSVKNYDASLAGPETKVGVLADARWAVENLDRLTPDQAGGLHADLMAKAKEAADPQTAATLVNYAARIEAKLRSSKAMNDARSNPTWPSIVPDYYSTETNLFAPDNNLQPGLVDDSLSRIK